MKAVVTTETKAIFGKNIVNIERKEFEDNDKNLFWAFANRLVCGLIKGEDELIDIATSEKRIVVEYISSLDLKVYVVTIDMIA